MDLLRLPLLVLIDVFKNMNFKEKGTVRRIDNNWIELKRRDGSEFFINPFGPSIRFYNKKAYLKKVREDEEYALARQLGNLRV
uniref:F-box domain-containing protein n=1 Tax=Caenorhabditis tropicalis TaxID=1561998 RepID=A0A1I7UTN9_9PELO